MQMKERGKLVMSSRVLARASPRLSGATPPTFTFASRIKNPSRIREYSVFSKPFKRDDRADRKRGTASSLSLTRVSRQVRMTDPRSVICRRDSSAILSLILALVSAACRTSIGESSQKTVQLKNRLRYHRFRRISKRSSIDKTTALC